MPIKLLNEMAVFAQVVENGGFTAAARQLGITTPAVSRHVGRLEKEIGGRLLQRTTRSIALTELGQQVYAGCARVLENAREVRALAGQYNAKPMGVVRVSAPVVLGQVWLAPQLASFLERNPEVNVQVTLVDRQVDLVEEEVDLAIRIALEVAPGLACRQLGKMRYVLVAAPGYLSENGSPSEPGALAEHQCVLLGYGPFGNELTMGRTGAEVKVKVQPRAALNNSAAILAVVEAGGGIGLVPYFTANASLIAGRVVQVLPEWEFGPPYSGNIHAVYTPGRYLALKTRALIDHLAVAGGLGD